MMRNQMEVTLFQCTQAVKTGTAKKDDIESQLLRLSIRTKILDGDELIHSPIML